MIKKWIYLLIVLGFIPGGVSSGISLIPWSHNPVIFPGFSGDADLNGVSDPDILYDGEMFRIYYTAIDSAGQKQIALAISQDTLSWLPVGIVLEPGPEGSFDDDDVWGPAVIQTAGRFVLYYSGSSGSEISIGRIESTDGHLFSREITPAFQVLAPSHEIDRFDSQGVSDPSVVQYAGWTVMMYEGHSTDIWHRLGISVSPDGIHFSRIDGEEGSDSIFGRGSHGFDDGGALEPELWIQDGDIRLFYTGLHY